VTIDGLSRSPDCTERRPCARVADCLCAAVGRTDLPVLFLCCSGSGWVRRHGGCWQRWLCAATARAISATRRSLPGPGIASYRFSAVPL